MAKKLSSVVGIDIGSRSIKVAELRSQGREFAVTALSLVDTPEGAVDHTGIYNAEAVANALKQALQNSGVTINQAVVSIAGQASVLVRTLEVPKMSPTELREHMQWEINRNIPFAESTVVSDFKVVDEGDANSANMDVVMAISPQSAIEMVMGCVKKAGKQVVAIDVEPLGLARSFFMSYGGDYNGQTICVVDIGHKTTSINIYRAKDQIQLMMPRQVPLGGEMFTKAVADALGVPMNEAEALKCSRADLSLLETAASSGAAGATQGFVAYNPFSDDPDQGPAPTAAASSSALASAGESGRVTQALSELASELAAEIRRSVDYYRSRGGEVNRMAICGGGARLSGLAGYLATATGLPCDLYDPLRRLSVTAKKAPADFVDEHRQEFAVAVGNGLHIAID